MKHIQLFEYYKPDTSAVMIMNEQNKVLILKRGSTAPWMPGYWNLPGGQIDKGENPEKAAIREAKEETNLDVSDLKSVGTKPHPDGWAIEVFFTRNYQGEIKLDENDDFAWISEEEVSNFNFVPLLVEYLEDVFKMV